MGRTVPCPHCGEDIRVDASFCRHCGSDAHTGWREDPPWTEERPDEFSDQDYEDFLRREFGSSSRPRLNRRSLAILLALALFLLALVLRPGS